MGYKGSSIVVCSMTVEGRKFRPSDWIERIACLAATYNSNRLKYHEHLYPAVRNGKKVLIVHEDEINESNPELYSFILKFVESNHLVCETDDMQP